MGRANWRKRTAQAANRTCVPGADLSQAGKRERPTRHQAPPTLPAVDVHGIIFAVVAIVFVVYPLARLAFSIGEQ